jgi:hypothetical protein
VRARAPGLTIAVQTENGSGNLLPRFSFGRFRHSAMTPNKTTVEALLQGLFIVTEVVVETYNNSRTDKIVFAIYFSYAGFVRLDFGLVKRN